MNGHLRQVVACNVLLQIISYDGNWASINLVILVFGGFCFLYACDLRGAMFDGSELVYVLEVVTKVSVRHVIGSTY